MTATGCCGVKKPKLSSTHQHIVGICQNGLGSLTPNSSSVSLAMNGYGNNSSNHHQLNNSNDPMEEEDEGQGSGPSSATRSRFQNGAVNGANGTVGGERPNKVVSQEMIVFCFDVLCHFLKGSDPPKTPKFPNDQFPLFVTWKLGKERKLRGCIGTFNCTNLHNGLREYAITSACKDSRFDPISPEEFSRLHCSVSLLMDFEMAEHYLDWEIGVHGIRIEFNSEKGSKKAATYLPEVAVEQGWNHIQTIDSLLRKGGFKGSITPDIRSSICVVRFQSDKLTISFAEYMAYKQTNDVQVVNHATNGHVTNGYSTSSSNHHVNVKKPSRLFPSLGGGHHHRYPTRGSSSSGDRSTDRDDHHSPSSSTSASDNPNVNSSITNHHPPSQAARDFPMLSQPYPPHQPPQPPM